MVIALKITAVKNSLLVEQYDNLILKLIKLHSTFILLQFLNCAVLYSVQCVFLFSNLKWVTLYYGNSVTKEKRQRSCV